MKGFRTIQGLKVLLLLASVMVASCQSEEMPPASEGAKTGCIVLSLPEVQLYNGGNTRATGSIADYTYKLNSVAGSAHVVVDSTIVFAGSSAVVPAGKYTLTFLYSLIVICSFKNFLYSIFYFFNHR